MSRIDYGDYKVLYSGKVLNPIIIYDEFRVYSKPRKLEVKVSAVLELENMILTHSTHVSKYVRISRDYEVIMYTIPHVVYTQGWESISGYLVIATPIDLVIQGDLVSEGHTTLKMMSFQFIEGGRLNKFEYGLEVVETESNVVGLSGDFYVREYGTIRDVEYNFYGTSVFIYEVKDYFIEILDDGHTIRVRLETIPEDLPFSPTGFVVYETEEEMNVAILRFEKVNNGYEFYMKSDKAIGRACSFLGLPSFNRTVAYPVCTHSVKSAFIEVSTSPNLVFKMKGFSLKGYKVILSIFCRGGIPTYVELNDIKIFHLNLEKLYEDEYRVNPYLPEEIAFKYGDLTRSFTLGDFKFRLKDAKVSDGISLFVYEGEFTRDLRLDELPKNYTFKAEGILWTINGEKDSSDSTRLKVLKYEVPDPSEMKRLSTSLVMLGFTIFLFRCTIRGLLLFHKGMYKGIDWFGVGRFIAYFVLIYTIIEFLEMLASPLKYSYIQTIMTIDDRCQLAKELYNGYYTLMNIALLSGSMTMTASRIGGLTAGKQLGLVLKGIEVIGSTILSGGKVMGSILEYLTKIMIHGLTIMIMFRYFFTFFYVTSYVIIALILLSPGLIAIRPTRGIGSYALSLFSVFWVGLPSLLSLTNYLLFKFGLDVSTLRSIATSTLLPIGINPLLAFRQLGLSVAVSTIGWLFGWTGGLGTISVLYLDLMIKTLVIPIVLFIVDVLILVWISIKLASWISGHGEVGDYISSALFSLIRI